MARRQSKRARRIARRVFGFLAFAAFLSAYGIVGGIEQDKIDLIPGVIWGFTTIGAFGLFSWLSGAWYPSE